MEFVATLPLVALAVLACLQALLLALALVFAQSAADRAARGAPRAQVVGSVPAGWRSAARIERAGCTVRVHVRPPAVLPGAARLLTVEATARRVPA